MGDAQFDTPVHSPSALRFRDGAGSGRVQHDAEDFSAREPTEGKRQNSEGQIDRSAHACARQIHGGVRNGVGLSEDGPQMGQIEGSVSVGKEHRHVVEAKRRIALEKRPDLARHGLQFAPDARMLVDLNARVALESVLDSISRECAVQGVALDFCEKGWRRRGNEPIVVIEAGRCVEQADLFAPRLAPQRERCRVARLDVFPEPFAWAQRIERDIAVSGDAREQLMEGGRKVGESEHVDGASGEARGLGPRGYRFVQGQEAASTRETAGTEHGQPKSSLPRLRLGESRSEHRPLSPPGKHGAARERVFLEEAPYPCRELHAPQSLGVGRTPSREVGTNRRELGKR